MYSLYLRGMMKMPALRYSIYVYVKAYSVSLNTRYFFVENYSESFVTEVSV